MLPQAVSFKLVTPSCALRLSGIKALRLVCSKIREMVVQSLTSACSTTW